MQFFHELFSMTLGRRLVKITKLTLKMTKQQNIVVLSVISQYFVSIVAFRLSDIHVLSVQLRSGLSNLEVFVQKKELFI